MKIKTILATALLSTSAFAADAHQKVDVGFAFRTPTGEHAAGAYKLAIRQTAASAHMELRSAETGKAVLFYPLSTLQAARGEQPRLVFKCGDANCDLAEIWTSQTGYAVRQRKSTAGEGEKLAVVVPATASTAE